MADKFFDSDNNMIYWNEASDLTEATKYKGSKIGMVGTSESLVKKIVKGEVEIETVSPPTPNEDQVVLDWGCGIKTYYKYGEPMYIPRAFLEEGITYYGSPNMSSGYEASGQTSNNPAPVKDNIGNHVGYQTWFTENTTGSTRPTTNAGWMAVYRLPNEVGEYLYNRAESSPTVGYYGLGDSESYRVYKEIAIYPNLVNSWDCSEEWTIGIRRKSDIGVTGHTSGGAPYSGGNYVNSDLPQWQALDDNAYYLVAQMKNDSITATSSMYFLSGQLGQAFPKDEFIYLRSFKGMTSKPSSDNMGKGMLYHPEKIYSLPLGGRVFYIDPSDNGATYSFYDENKNEITGWSTVADLVNAKYYLVDGTPSKDKFYVYHDEIYTSLRWTYYKRGYVYETTDGLQQTIGSGKSNTDIMMAKDGGAYVAENSDGYPTIWYQLQQTRLAKAGGCDDWFIPSQYEIEELRKAIGFQVVTTKDSPVILSAGKVTGGVIAGTADGQSHYIDNSTINRRTCYPSATKFLDNDIWASSEYGTHHANVWLYGDQYWNSYIKFGNLSVFFVRAF